MEIVQFMFYLYLLLRPYYLFKSGTLQISDFFLLIGFLFLLILKSKNKSLLSSAINENKHFIFYLLLCLSINTIYWLIAPDLRYILSCLFLIFNFIAIILFSCLYKNSNSFGKNCLKIFKINLIIQLIIYLTGLGRFYQSSRYMGTFNDPNQFGYYILISFAFINILSNRYDTNNTKNSIIYTIITAFLLMMSQSTGMFLGFSVMVVLLILLNIKKRIKNSNKIKKTLLWLLMFIPVIILILLIFNISINDAINIINNSNIIERVSSKMNKIENNDSNNVTIWQDRALDYIALYPQYLLYGAGEGGETRFVKVHHYTEIHSTFPALLFYYGIIPFSILIKWIYNKLKRIKTEYLIIYIGLIAESFTLANQRQALFWIIISLAGFLKEEKQ